jgi:16S rRNA (adenine(1408)-N(1))-methyltransferase
MAEVSRRAARAADRGGQPNVLFVASAAERPPAELIGLADEVSILFPWGSLLRGLLGTAPNADDAAIGIASLLKRGGRLSALVSVTRRDAAIGVPDLAVTSGAAVAAFWAQRNLDLTAFRPATTEEIESSGSTWARRLLAGGGGRHRPVWRLEAKAVAETSRLAAVE